MKKQITVPCLLLFLSIASILCPVSATSNPVPPKFQSVLVKAGTEVNLRLIEKVVSKDVAAGHFVDLEVDIDVVVEGGHKVIATRSYATGKVTKLKKKGLFGRGALLEIQPVSVKAIDGTTIPLEGSPIQVKGKNRTPLVVVTGALLAGLTGIIIGAGNEERDFAAGGVAAASLAVFIEGAPAELNQKKLFYAKVKEDRLVTTN